VIKHIFRFNFIFLTLTAAKDHELAGFVGAVEVEPAQLGLTPAAVHGEAADGLTWLQHPCTQHNHQIMCQMDTSK